MNWCRLLIYPIINNILLEPKKGKDPHFQILNNTLKI